MSQFKKNGFTFKHFFVEHDKSPMKVTTDSVLLAAWCSIRPSFHSILDIGTGCGVIALILAQRFNELNQTASFIGVDISDAAVEQAQSNFDQSPYENLKAMQGDIKDLAAESESRYQLIVSNPPYFEAANPCRDEARYSARYTDQLSFNDLILSVKQLLDLEGLFALILPVTRVSEFTHLAEQNGLFLNRIMRLKHTESHSYSLALCELSFNRCQRQEEILTLKTDNHRYSEQAKALLAPYYFKMEH